MENLEEKVKKNTTLDPKRKEFFEKLNRMLDEYNFKISISVNFPDYLAPPEDLALALQVIAKHKHNMVINLEDK